MKSLWKGAALAAAVGLLAAGCGGGGGGGGAQSPAAIASTFTGTWQGGSNTFPVSSVGQVVNGAALVDDQGTAINAIWQGMVGSDGAIDGTANLPTPGGAINTWRITGVSNIDTAGHWKGTLKIWTYAANPNVITFDLIKQ